MDGGRVSIPFRAVAGFFVIAPRFQQLWNHIVSIPFRAVAGFFAIRSSGGTKRSTIVSIPFRAVAGFFDTLILRHMPGRSDRFNPFQGCRWVLWRVANQRRDFHFKSFNPFQGCRWVLWLCICGLLCSSNRFQSLSGLSLGSLVDAMKDGDEYIGSFNPFQGCRWVLCISNLLSI